jgi:hypothetical protein
MPDASDVACPKSGGKHFLRIPALESRQEFKFLCVACGSPIIVDNGVSGGFRKIDQSIKDIFRKLKF